MLLPRALDVFALQQPQLADQSLARLAWSDDVIQEAVSSSTQRGVELVFVSAHLLQIKQHDSMKERQKKQAVMCT